MEYFLTDLQKTVKQMARTIAEGKMLSLRAEGDMGASKTRRSLCGSGRGDVGFLLRRRSL